MKEEKKSFIDEKCSRKGADQSPRFRFRIGGGEKGKGKRL